MIVQIRYFLESSESYGGDIRTGRKPWDGWRGFSFK